MSGELHHRPVVLVHGAWHGAWCWAALQSALDRRGVASLAIDLPGHGTSTLPLGDLHDDADHVARTLDALGLDDIVLVGHSYGGAVISDAAAGRSDVAQLVYVAAFALSAGESVMDPLSTLPPADTALSRAMAQQPDGTAIVDPAGATAAFYAQCPPGIAAAAIARLCPQPLATFTQPTRASALGTIESLYVRCLRDQAVHPDHQAALAARCSTSIDLDTDHSPFASRSEDLADILAGLA